MDYKPHVMSGRVYKSRSTFDDPGGNDPSYRLGSVIQGIAQQGMDWKSEYPQGTKRYISNKPMFRAAKRFKAASAAVSAAPRKPYRRRAGLLSTNKTRGSRYRKFYKRRPMRQMSRRRTTVRRFGKVSKATTAALAAAKDVIPIQLRAESTQTLANVGDNLQNKCSWLVVRPSSPGIIDQILTAGSRQTVVTNVAATAKVVQRSLKHHVQFKNAANHRLDLTIWAIKPRRDLPAAFSDFTSINPQFVQDAFQQRFLTTVSGARLNAYNEHGADPFQSSLPSIFHMRQVSRKYISPGGFYTLNYKQGARVWSKAMFGLQGIATSVASSFDYVKQQGIMYLVRAQGPMVHNEGKVSTGAASFTASSGAAPALVAEQIVDNGLTSWNQTAGPPATGPTFTNTGPYGTMATMGGYCCSVYQLKTIELYGHTGAEQPAKEYGTLSQALPSSILRTQEATYEAIQPYEAGLSG